MQDLTSEFLGSFNNKWQILPFQYQFIQDFIYTIFQLLIFRILLYINQNDFQEFNCDQLNEIYKKGSIQYLMKQKSIEHYEKFNIKTIRSFAQRFDLIYVYIDKNTDKYRPLINYYNLDIFIERVDQEKLLIDRNHYFTSYFQQIQLDIDKDIDDNFFKEQLLQKMLILEIIFFQKSQVKRNLQKLINFYYFYQFFCIIIIFVYEMILVNQFMKQNKYSGFDRYQCLCFILINSVNFKNIMNDYLAYIMIGFYFNILGKNDFEIKNQVFNGLRQQFRYLNWILGGNTYEQSFSYTCMDFYPYFFAQFVYLTILIPFLITHFISASIIFFPFTVAYKVVFWILGKIQDSQKNRFQKFIFSFICILLGILVILMVIFQINLIIYFYMGFSWSDCYKQSFSLITASNYQNIMFNSTNTYESISKYISILRAVF